MGQIVLIAASLAAVLFLSWIAHRLHLGGDRRIADEQEARRLADEAICGFEAVDVALDRAGVGALLRDADGRILLLRRHGSHFAARLLDSRAKVSLDRSFLSLGTSDRRFGTVTLDLGAKAAVWAASLRRIPA